MRKCNYRGLELAQIPCPSCQGNVQLKSFACALHSRCTISKKVAEAACCDLCDDCTSLVKPTGLELPPATYNGGVIHFRGRRVMAFRQNWNGSRIATCDVDSTLKPSSKPVLLDLPKCHLNYHGSEDPRLFVFRGKLHVSYTGWDNQTATILVSRLTDDTKRVEYSFHASEAFGGRWQKNWGFFESNNELHAVHTIAPHFVLRFRSHVYHETIETTWQPRWSHGELRGGAAPVLVGNEFWSFFHSVEPGPLGRRYVAGLYTFEAKPPFRPLRIISEPLILPLTRQRDQVVFPCGAMIEGNEWVITGGVEHEGLAAWRLSHAELEERLEPC